jgi:hypothetical protein
MMPHSRRQKIRAQVSHHRGPAPLIPAIICGTPLRFCIIPFHWATTFIDFLGGNF